MWEWPNYGGALLHTALSETPEPVDDIFGAVGVSAGDTHSIALLDSGEVWCWGDNQYGQLGDGTTSDSAEPVRTGALDDIIEVSAGAYHSLALSENGKICAWGDNTYGQLGDGTFNQSETPVMVKIQVPTAISFDQPQYSIPIPYRRTSTIAVHATVYDEDAQLIVNAAVKYPLFL